LGSFIRLPLPIFFADNFNLNRTLSQSKKGFPFKPGCASQIFTFVIIKNLGLQFKLLKINLISNTIILTSNKKTYVTNKIIIFAGTFKMKK